MAITITPCNAAGEAVQRSQMTYRLSRGEIPAVKESVPCVRIANTGSAQYITLSCTIWDYFVSNNNGTRSLRMLVPANSNAVYALPITFDLIAAWQSVYKGQTISAAELSCGVDITYSTQAGTDEIDILINAAELVAWANERGWPEFAESGTYIQRSRWADNRWYDDDAGRDLRAFCSLKRPAHFPWPVRVVINIYDKAGGTITQKVTNQARGQDTRRQDSDTERYGDVAFCPAYNLSGAVKVTMELQWAIDSSFTSPHTVTTLTLYKSYAQPILTAAGTGDDIDILLSDALKVKLLDCLFPVGASIFALSPAALQDRLNAMPGEWTKSTAYWEIDTTQGTMQVYTATRTD